MNIDKVIEISKEINGQSIRDVLKHLYVDKGLSSRQVGKILDTSHTHVCRMLKENGVVRKIKC